MMSLKLLESNDETLFMEVLSSDGTQWYDVWYDRDHHWLCTCPDYYYRKRYCKHMKQCAELIGISDVAVYAGVNV
ncbi:hypothetical protein [Methanobrevibacter sp. V74]|uniref:hypothetical protein n=1 Tax=Methanobrevibacter sp. V74 TaxID=3064279 RepID=UPI0027373D58|nr:hypothetical protein [Methanobrevibacter sp. V74]